MDAWKPRRDSIDDKEKTGDSEQLRILWQVHAAVTGSKDLGSREKAKEFAEKTLEKFDSMNVHTTAVFGMVRDIVQTLGQDLIPFVVNLVLFDFKTTGGGRARKSTSALREGADDFYARPFEGYLPNYVNALLKLVKGTRTQAGGTTSVALSGDDKYLPPTRFTVTFPLLLKGQHGPLKGDGSEAPILVKPQVPDKDPVDLKFAFLASFGFAEPTYCTWREATEHESAGTRLSVGAYALDAAYVAQILFLLKSLGSGTKESTLSSQYGSATELHLTTLQEKFKDGKGYALALTWVKQMAAVANALASVAAKPKTKALAPLEGFFTFLLDKIATRMKKLELTEKSGGLGKEPNLFDYLWVYESTLWEYAFMAATCLPMSDIAGILQDVVKGWTPTVSLSESSLEETVKVGSCTFTRVYCSSGSSAATCLYDTLWDLGWGPVTLEVDAKMLSTFTPYFEFYQGTTALLSEERVTSKAGGSKAFPAAQMWINLSDSLHGGILSNKLAKLADVGDFIAKEAVGYVTQLHKLKASGSKTTVTVDLSKLCLVVDYTKFGGDMPNDRLYPILAQLRATLLKALSSSSPAVLDVVFFRSNLKYNTGSLERYQSGEILVVDDVIKGLTKALSTAASKTFTTGASADQWSLKGEYVPLMKRLYLLTDAVSFHHWQVYS